MKPAIFVGIMAVLFLFTGTCFAYFCFPSVKAQVSEILGTGDNEIYDLSAGENPSSRYIAKLEKHRGLIVSVAEKYVATSGDKRMARWLKKLKDPALMMKIDHAIEQVNNDPKLRAKLDEKLNEKFIGDPGKERVAREALSILFKSHASKTLPSGQKIKELLQTVEVRNLISKYSKKPGDLEGNAELSSKIKNVMDRFDLGDSSAEELPTVDDWAMPEQNKIEAPKSVPAEKPKSIKYQEETLPVFE